MILALVQGLWHRVTTCPHHGLTSGDGRAFCPDCEQWVVSMWVVLRCDHCHRRQPTQQLWGQVFPVGGEVCGHCGETGCSPVVLKNPSYFQLKEAVILREVDRAESFTLLNRWHQTLASVRVWLDPDCSLSPGMVMISSS